jgi:hypothetical protein
MKKAKQLICFGMVSLGCLLSAQANTITLYNTGVDSLGAVLADGTIGDPHYSLIGVPGGTTDIRVRSAAGYPIPPYVGGFAGSAWIGPNNNASLDGPVGHYTYRTTFDLSGLNPLTASITGGWSSDNNGVGIFLNGVDTGNLGTSFTQFSAGFAPFSILSGFLPAVNTLDFVVYNGGGPTALRVELSGTADPLSQGVPDGGLTGMLLGLGIAALGLIRRRM